MKNILYFIVIICGLCSCGQSSPSESAVNNDTAKKKSTVSYVEQSESNARKNAEDYVESSIDTFYIVQVAEGTNYDSLLHISQDAARILGSRFDMLDRTYKANKGIVVPESSEDEIYRGDYYPRRPFESQNFVSIEMSTSFLKNELDTLKMIVLANICKTKSEADSIAGILKKDFTNAKSLKSELFMGCMH